MHTAYFYKYTIPKIERIFNSILPCDNYHVYVVFKINKFFTMYDFISHNCDSTEEILLNQYMFIMTPTEEPKPMTQGPRISLFR